MQRPTVILATAGYDHNIRLWEAHSGICYRTIPYGDSQVNKLDITPDKQYIAAAGNPHIRFFEVNTNNPNPVTSYDGHKTNVTCIGFQREGKWMYTGSEDNTIKIWDLRAPGCQRNFECSGPVNAAVLHPNQAELISGDQNGNIRVWDLNASACSRELIPDGETAVRSVTVSSDGSRVAAGNNAGKCFVWRLAAEKDTSRFDPLQKIEAHKGAYLLKCLFSPDAKLLATASADHTVKLWTAGAGGVAGGGALKNSDGAAAAAGSATSGSASPAPGAGSGAGGFSLHKQLTGHQRWVWDAVFSADSAYLVTASSDQIARLWDLQQGETIRTYTGHTKAITCVALNDSAS